MFVQPLSLHSQIFYIFVNPAVLKKKNQLVKLERFLPSHGIPARRLCVLSAKFISLSFLLLKNVLQLKEMQWRYLILSGRG